MSGSKGIEQEYEERVSKRELITSKVEEYATWTLPSVFPMTGTTTTEELQNDVQSFGAQAVNHLSNKLMVGLFNPSRPFFRLDTTKEFEEELAANNIPPEAIQSALHGAERESVKELDRLGAREPFTMLLMLLIITGNGLIYFPKDGKIQTYSMRDYVISRDITGFPIRIIIHDAKKTESLPTDVQEKLMKAKPQGTDSEMDTKLYTDIKWDLKLKKYIVHQYADGVKLTDDKTKGVYTIDTLPYIPLVWKLVRGEDWGRGLVEDYAGDFHSLSTAERSALELISIIGQVKGMVDPAGVTDVSELNNTANGQWCSGREADVSLVQYSELQQALASLEAYIDKKERRLSKAFLMDSAGVRNAERVTAEEIRLVARDLEMALGGVYTRLAQTFQLPVTKLLLVKIDFKIKGNKVEPIITTGLSALSRSGDLDAYRFFVQDASLIAQLDPEVRAELSIPQLLHFLAINNNLDPEVAFKSEEAKEQALQAQADSEQQAVDDEVRIKSEPQQLAQDNGA